MDISIDYTPLNHPLNLINIFLSRACIRKYLYIMYVHLYVPGIVKFLTSYFILHLLDQSFCELSALRTPSLALE